MQWSFLKQYKSYLIGFYVFAGKKILYQYSCEIMDAREK
jgi:hypothetical protein